MDKSHANMAIHCTVDSCKNHCSSAEFCALDKVTIGTHECDPTVEQCTDCMSFQKE